MNEQDRGDWIAEPCQACRHKRHDPKACPVPDCRCKGDDYLDAGRL